ncbi:MAG: hypothetical protein ACD_43C00212G0007 [uncultured bacterium]|nr:MAG: hypothetical protein ACD_43C00212G0007 [uncultured bacterium]
MKSFRDMLSGGADAANAWYEKKTFGATPAEVRETREHGMEGLEQWSREMYQVFTEKFDPHHRETTTPIYGVAHRTKRILRGPMGELMYSGALGSVGSLLGKAAGGDQGRRKRIQTFLVETADGRIAELAAMQLALTEHFDLTNFAQEMPSVRILPLKGGHKPGINPNNFPAMRQYIDEQRQLASTINRVVEPFGDLENVSALLRPDDRLTMMQLSRTVQLDLKLWTAIAVELRSNDSRRYDAGTLNSYNSLMHDENGLAGVVDQYERTYTTDGLSETDRSIRYLLGGVVYDSFEADLGERVNITEINAAFADPLGYFTLLKLDPKELIGLPEKEATKKVRKCYYKEVPRCHPDTNPHDPTAEQRFKDLTTAYDVLIDAEKRKRYLAS